LAEQAFQQASMSLSVFDTEQRYLRLNDVACRVMGVPEDVLIGRFFPESVEDAEHSHSFLNNLRLVAETGRPVRYNSWAGAPALNREHAWSIEMWPLKDDSGEVTGVALSAFDSTEQYLAQQRLALLNEAAAGIGTTLDVVRTAEELVEILVPRYADFASVDLLPWVLGADEPPPTPDGEIVLRRVAHGSVTEGAPDAAVHLGQADVYPPSSPPVRALREGRRCAVRRANPTSPAGSRNATPASPRAVRTARASTR
jgi:PAS domain S-box-containing protein